MDSTCAIAGETGSIPPLEGVQNFLQVNTRIFRVVGSSSELLRMRTLALTVDAHRRIALCGNLGRSRPM